MTTYNSISEALTNVLGRIFQKVEMKFNIVVGYGKDYDEFLSSTSTKENDCFINMNTCDITNEYLDKTSDMQRFTATVFIKTTGNIENLIIKINKYLNIENAFNVDLQGSYGRFKIKNAGGSFLSEYKGYYELNLEIKGEL